MALSQRHLITVAEWRRMGKAGVFDDDLRLELLDGEILEMSPIYPPHQESIDRTTECFVRGFGERLIVRIQGPVVLDDWSEPVPDVALLERRPERYGERAPEPPQVYLLIEVSDSTLRRDRRKLRRYAAAGVREAWIFNLREDRIEVHTQPGEDGYGAIAVVRRGESVACAAFPDVVFPVDDLLP